MCENKTIALLKQLNEPAIICHHLIENPCLHLNFPYDIDEDDQAWCDECEKILQEEQGWTDRALKFANLKTCCKYCFAELKQKYRNSLSGGR